MRMGRLVDRCSQQLGAGRRSRDMRMRWSRPPGGVEVAEWGWENSRDYILLGRTPGEPSRHEIEDPPIPGEGARL